MSVWELQPVLCESLDGLCRDCLCQGLRDALASRRGAVGIDHWERSWCFSRDRSLKICTAKDLLLSQAWGQSTEIDVNSLNRMEENTQGAVKACQYRNRYFKCSRTAQISPSFELHSLIDLLLILIRVRLCNLPTTVSIEVCPAPCRCSLIELWKLKSTSQPS